MSHDSLVDFDVFAEERRVNVRRIVEQLHQRVLEQLRASAEPSARPELRLGRRTQQVENEIDAGPLLGDVVLQVRVEPLVAKVQLRCHRDQQRPKVERLELEIVTQARQR